MTPCLSSSLAAKVTEGLKTLPQLKEVTIINPKDVVQLPHWTSLRSFKISGLPPECDDWDWLKDVQDLEKLDLQISEQSQGSTAEVEFNMVTLGSVFIHDKKAKLVMNDPKSTKLLGKVMSSLPSRMYKEVCI